MFAVVPKLEIQQQLDHMLNSNTFQRAIVRKALLKYLVGKTLQDKEPEEWEITKDVFNEEWVYGQSEKIRVSILRLNAALRKYYLGDGKTDSVIIRIEVRRAIAEYRIPATIIAPQRTRIFDFLSAAHEDFFITDGAALHCVVTGQHEDVSWHPLDGDQRNVNLGNLVPLCGNLRSHIKGVERKRRKTMPPGLDPKALSEKIAPKHFREWRVADAYGCAMLAFYMGRPPFGNESVNQQILRLCDAIHYARHRFIEPLIHQILQNIALPFLIRIESIDPVAALRLSLQLTALLEEACYYKDAQDALKLATHAEAGSRLPPITVHRMLLRCCEGRFNYKQRLTQQLKLSLIP